MENMLAVVGRIMPFIVVAIVLGGFRVNWTVIFSVMVGLFLFNILKGIITILTGLLIARKQKVGEIDTSKPRGDFL